MQDSYLINNLSWTETGSLTPHPHPSHLTCIPHTSPASLTPHLHLPTYLTPHPHLSHLVHFPQALPESLSPHLHPAHIACIFLTSPTSPSPCLCLPHFAHIPLTCPHPIDLTHIPLMTMSTPLSHLHPCPISSNVLLACYIDINNHLPYEIQSCLALGLCKYWALVFASHWT